MLRFQKFHTTVQHSKSNSLWCIFPLVAPVSFSHLNMLSLKTTRQEDINTKTNIASGAHCRVNICWFLVIIIIKGKIVIKLLILFINVYLIEFSYLAVYCIGMQINSTPVWFIVNEVDIEGTFINGDATQHFQVIPSCKALIESVHQSILKQQWTKIHTSHITPPIYWLLICLAVHREVA